MHTIIVMKIQKPNTVNQQSNINTNTSANVPHTHTQTHASIFLFLATILCVYDKNMNRNEICFNTFLQLRSPHATCNMPLHK